MNSKDIDQKIQKLLDGKLPAGKLKQLRKQLRAHGENTDNFELYRSLERKLGQLGDDIDSKDWDTQHDAIRNAMERDALLGEAKRPVWPGIARAVAAVTIIAAAIIFLPSGLKWLASKAPVPATSIVKVQWSEPETPTLQEKISTEMVKPASPEESELQVKVLAPDANLLPVGKPVSAAIIVIIKPKSAALTPAQMLCAF